MPHDRPHRPSRREVSRGAVAAGATLATGAVRVRAQTAALKLGVLLPRSGFEALIGQGCQRGFELAVPLLREMGTPIELMSADTESKPDVARTQAEKLIREGAQVLCGAFNSGQTAAIAQVCEQRGVPLVINIAADPKITEQGYKFVFRNFPNAAMLSTGALAVVKDLFDATGKTPKTAVLMAVNDTFGQAAQARSRPCCRSWTCRSAWSTQSRTIRRRAISRSRSPRPRPPARNSISASLGSMTAS